VAAVVAAAVLVAVVVIVAATGSRGGSSRPDPTGVPLPLTSSLTTASQTSVVLAMGHLDDPANTFWQLFLRPAAGGAWRLATPPGVADNGGLAASVPAAGPLTVGFLTSADLRFSPVAQSTDGGSTWTPGQLPTALVPAPSSLAAGTGDDLVALVSAAGQSVLTSTGSTTNWQPLVTTAALARAVPACGATRITAVAFDAADQPVVGVRCARAGEPGVLTPAGGGMPRPGATAATPWRDLEPATPAVPGTSTVLRLDTTSAGLQGLDEQQSGSSASLVALWAQGVNGRWATSPALSLAPGWSVAATAMGGGTGGTGTAVLLASGTARRIEETAGPGAPWTALPGVPAGTGALAATGTTTDAFVVSGSHLAVWSWTPGATGWSRTATLTVPIQYGSSS
jgi:hypothetical protein